MTSKNFMPKKIFISADHGMAIIYFLQSHVVPTLLAAGVEIIVLTDDETKDWRIRYKGVTAMVGASHWQFTAYKSTLQQFLPFDMDKPMGQVRQLDKHMNDAGLLRLMISDPLAMNMSNTLGYLRGELGKAEVKNKRGISLKKRVLELGPIKKMLLTVYNKIFNWYYS